MPKDVFMPNAHNFLARSGGETFLEKFNPIQTSRPKYDIISTTWAAEVLGVVSYLNLHQITDQKIVDPLPEDNGFCVLAGLVAFLEARGKFKPAGAGFTMDRDKVCGDY